MRIALLSALADPSRAGAGPGEGERPAFRRFAGKTVLAHQIDCAAHLRCERVLCMSGDTAPEISAARNYAERAGLRFERVDSLARLMSRITATDEIVLIADGVLPDRRALVKALGARPRILAFPAEPALSRGFERIDAERAWSGVLSAPGHCVARLADLPGDCELASSLLRIALQAGVEITLIDAELMRDSRWLRRVERDADTQSEWRWVTSQVGPAPFTAPGLAATERAGLLWAREVAGGRWRYAPHTIGGACGLGAVAAGFGDRPAVGLALLLIASMASAVAAIAGRVESLGAPRARGRRGFAVAGWLVDGALLGLLAKAVVIVPGWIAWALPAVLIGLLRIGERSGPPALRPPFADRPLQIAGLAMAAYAGYATAAVTAAIVAAVGVLLWTAYRPGKQLTAD